MASSGVSGFGTVLLWNYCRVVELANISGPSQSAGTIDVTSHDSDDGYEEFVAGTRSGGDISLEGNFVSGDSAGQIAFHTDIQGGTERTAYIVLPMAVGQSMTFSGIASGFSSSFPYNDKLGISGTIKVAGKPTLLTTQSAGMTDLTGIEETDTEALVIPESPAVGTYDYTCSVDTDSTWIKLTVTAASHSIYVNGTAQSTGVQGGEIAIGAAGTTVDVTIVAFEANESPRIYTLAVTRAAA